MNRKVFKTCAALFATAFGLLAGPAEAQSPPTTVNGDFPNLGAYNNRQGQNANPLLYTSGLNNLRWRTQAASLAQVLSIVLDNTSFTNTNGFNGGPYDPPAYGFVVPVDQVQTSVGTPTMLGAAQNVWYGIASNDDNGAQDPYTQPRRISTTPLDSTDRDPAYDYARCTPSAHGTDPRVPLVPGELKIWEWNFTPPVTTSAQNYAVSVWLPAGGTIAPTINPTQRSFSQRYLVYEIIYGNNQSYIDVIDTATTGAGPVRLGSENDLVFPWDNVHPIRVRLYNTIPRANGVLAVDGAQSGSSDAQEASLAHKYLVYADECELNPKSGNYLASPTAATWTPGSFTTIDWQVTAAQNLYVAGTSNGSFAQTTNGVVTSYQANPLLWPTITVPDPKWNFSTVNDSANATSLDDPAATFSGDFAPVTTGAQIGTTHEEATANTTETATGVYRPTLADGSYAIYVYLPGNAALARGVTYRIYSGTTVVDTVVLDQSVSAGWVRLGGQFYAHDSTGDTLHVEISNLDNVTGDSGARQVFADAMKFVSPTSIGISSTPVHATVGIRKTPGGDPVATKVVIVADESGKIHCLDMRGNGDGTTTEYWSYPSSLPSTVADPNLTSGNDGVINPSVTPVGSNVPTAHMPGGFDLSTAAIATIGSQDLLYIASTNGRVYCLDMAGRGDFDVTTRQIGTTKRVWTYPNDYDPTAPTAPIGSSSLGAVRGSIVFADASQGASVPTVYVPARQGRIYALSALGTGTEPAQTRTHTRWTFPSPNTTTLPEIVMTPTLAFGNLYFGTVRNANNDGPGQFFALNEETGAQVWRFDGTATSSDITEYIDPTDTSQGRVAVGAFITGPVAISATELNQSATGHVNSIYALNQNTFLYGFNAATGQILTGGTNTDGSTRRYESNELNSLAYGNLTYTWTTEYSTSGGTGSFPVIVVPGEEGILHRAFARLEDSNVFEGITAGYNIGLGTNLTSAAAANNTLFTANAQGVLYAFDNIVNSTSLLYPSLSGGQAGVPPNDPRGKRYRTLKIRLLNRAAYLALRTRNANSEGSLTYQDIVGGAYDRPAPKAPNKQYAFEWGETAYVLVYDFPYTTTNAASPPDAISPPQINVTLSIEGKVSRTRGITSQKFKNDTGDTIDDGNGGTYLSDGYAIYPFTFQGGGAMSLPPGNGVISATLTTAAINTTPGNVTPTEISQDPRLSSTARVAFIMANPLALIVETTFGGVQHGIAAMKLGNNLTGTTDSYDPANRVNGSPDVLELTGPDTAENESRLLATGGFAQHGSNVTARVYVVDRSLMSLIRPEGRSIENLRVSRSNLALQGGTLGLYRLLDPALYPNFEDLPNRYPNDSLDYPDIGRENIATISNPETEPDNPVLQPINLLPPLDATTLGYYNEDSDTAGHVRIPQRTPLNLVINVPRYQPPVNVFPGTKIAVAPATEDESTDLTNLRHDSVGAVAAAQGYFGRMTAFVDSSGDGKLAIDSSEPYRSFNLSVGVLPQLSILAATPNVDLGSLASGTGYAPFDPTLGNVLSGPFSPWGGIWGDEYKPFEVQNDGNVNLLNLRLAKAGNSGVPYSKQNNQPWQIVPSDADPNAWLGGSLTDANGNVLPGALWSNIDATFATPYSGINRVILPKPRVTDREPTALSADPYPRANPNTGARGSSTQALNYNNGYATTTPKVGVTVPIGFPVGNYASKLKVIEDDSLDFNNANQGNFDQVLNYFLGLQTSEAYSGDITLSFKVRETRMTNASTPRTATVIDSNLLPTSAATLTSAYVNSSPGAMRLLNGDVDVAWSSNRPKVSPTNATVDPPTTRGNRLFFAQLTQLNGGTKDNDKAPGYNPPLWDLSQFDQTGTSFFTKSTAFPNGYPTNPGPLFMAGTGETVDDNFVNFESPSFAVAGNADPLTPGNTIQPLMAFVGNAEVATQTGRVTRSRVFLSPVTGRGNALQPTQASPSFTQDDPLTAKGKPSLVQLSGTAFVFYPVTSAGQTGINVSRFTNVFDRPVTLDFGNGFSSVTSPSVNARTYLGQTSTTSMIAQNQPILEFSFAGKLRGAANAQAYLGRMRLAKASDGTFQITDGQGNAIGLQGSGSGFALLPQQVRERLVGEGGGLFRARGVDWSRTSGLELVQVLTTGASTSFVNVLIGSPTIDRQSGFIIYDSRLGGKVYLDPNLGTARFVGGTVSANAELRLTYTPTFLRVNSRTGGTSYSSINGLFDGRNVSERDYWFFGTASATTDTYGNPLYSNVPGSTPLHNDRTFFTYGRGAGSGAAARPFYTTMRFGLRLPTRVATNAGGQILGVTVSGNDYPYQVDAANGRLYFEAGDEGKTVNVSYTGIDEATNTTVTGVTLSGSVSYVLERDETQVPVDEAVNDSSLTAFLDPFDYANVPRPPLVWMFYVSTRGGSPDIYFQTLAPRLSPFSK